MRDQNINTFQKGMMTDLGETLPQDGNYVYGENIRIVSNDSESGETGVVVNVKGNSQYCPLVRNVFSIEPELEETGPEMEDPGGADVGEGIGDEVRVFKTKNLTSNIKVIGSTFVRNKIVLFGVSSCVEGENCLGIETYGIYVINLDDSNPQISVVYEGEDLNFDANSTIEAIGRYENELTERVYFTDNINPVRLINLIDPAQNAAQLNLIPSVGFPQLEVKRIVAGGSLPAGVYQYAYRLKTKQGLESRFSTFTPPIHIVDSGNYYWKHEEDPEDRIEINGNPPGTETNKLVELKVEGLDTSYDYVEFAAIHRTTNQGIQSGNVYIFTQKEIISNSVIVRHSNNSSTGTISLQEALAFAFNVDTAKTMATKDNKLFLGNLTEKQIDLELDMRAYRWKRTDGIHYPYKPTEYVSTYNNADDINPFNDIDGNDRDSNKKYKYQSDGVTLGGEGTHISYKFTKKILEGDTLAGSSPGSPPFVASNITDSQCEQSDGYDPEKSILDYKSGQANMFKGYQRDEIYRFAVVFYDLKGNPGYVNWIGDIRFPAADDVDITRFYDGSGNLTLPVAPLNPDQEITGATYGNTDTHSPMNYSLSQTAISQGANYYMSLSNPAHVDLTVQEGSEYQVAHLFNSGGMYPSGGVNEEYQENYGTNYTNQGKHYLYALGIEFTLNLPDDFKEKISGYKIVRVPRTDVDKTVLGVGLINYFHKFYEIIGNNISRMVLGYNRNLYYKLDYGSPKLYYGNNGLHSLLSFDSPEFPFTQNYPTADDCTYFEYYGSLADGRERNAFRDSFEGTTHINYRKYLAHVVERMKPLALSGQAALYTAYGFDSLGGWDGVQGYWDIPRRFNIVSMYKLGQGETKKANLYGNLNFDEFNEPQLKPAAELYNYSLETEFNSIVGGGFFNYGGISTGEETLFIQLPQGFLQDSNAASFGPNYNDEEISQINPPNMGLHFLNWMPRYTTNGLGFSGDAIYHTNNHEPSSVSGTNMQNMIRYNKLLGILKRNLGDGENKTQYGGVTEILRQSNTYISAGKFELKDTRTTKVFNGDTYVTFYDLEKVRMFTAAGDNPDLGGHLNTQFNSDEDDVPVRGYSFVFPVETTINTTLRTGYHMANKQNFTLNDNTTMLNQFLYDTTYSAEDDLQKYYPKSENRFVPEEFDFRIAYSDTKDDSELIDSWRNFRPLNYKDLEGSQGAINKLATVGENMVFLQNRGVGMLKISPLSTTLDQTGSSIVLGKGETIADFQYFSRTTGLKNNYAAITTGNSIYWLDETERNLYKIGGKGLVNLSDSLKINSLIEHALNREHNIRLGYDHINNEVLFNLNPESTLVFNELTNSFTSIYTMDTELFVESAIGLFSLGDVSLEGSSTNYLFAHNTSGYSWYNKPYNSSIEFIVNKNPILPKVFDNLEWYAIGGLPQEDLFEHAEFNNSHETASVNFETNFPYKKVKEKMAKTPIPRNQNNGRFRDTYLKIKLITENTKKVALHYVKTLFRISRR